MRQWFVYRGGPVDDFSAFKLWREYAESTSAEWCFPEKNECNALAIAKEMMELASDLNAAMNAARNCGWEGDIRGGEGGPCGPYVIPLLDHVSEPGVEPGVAFVWKQDNNGETFVVSPSQLPLFCGWACSVVALEDC